MIALWMACSLLVGSLVAAACLLLERIVLAARLPTRAVWVGGMGAMLVATLWAAPIPPRPSAGVEISAVAASSPSATVRVASDFGGPARRWMGQVNRRISVVGERLSGWDRPLLLAWALLAAFFAGVVLHAALEGRRLRRGLQVRRLAGTPVLLTQDVGPSATGIVNPLILVPHWALDLDDERLALLLRHEREHLAARDPLLLLLTLIPIVLMPWHLPLWWMRKRLQLAVEVDCDRRVLRAHPDVRRYAELLLHLVERAPMLSRASVPVATAVAPLRPRPSHLARRITAMTEPQRPRLLLRTIPAMLGLVALAALLPILPRPADAAAQAARDQRAIVRLTKVGVSVSSLPMDIVIYTTGAARVGIGIDEPTLLTDTLRLDRLPAITADVTEGEVHVEIRSPGQISLGGEVSGGPAREVSASGRHIVIMKGAVGIRGAL
ncbi:MAG TPA: M56 family metallopeptidase [Longimicrobiaceae bacterium]